VLLTLLWLVMALNLSASTKYLLTSIEWLAALISCLAATMMVVMVGADRFDYLVRTSEYELAPVFKFEVKRCEE